MRHTLLAVAALSVAAGCTCDTNTARRFPKIEVLDAVGNERTAVDFGQVQVNATAEQRVRVRNSGNLPLSISSATFTDAKFGVTNVPAAVDVNGELELVFTFTPTEPDLRVTGTVTLATDDPAKPTVQLSLAGTGVAAVANVLPTRLDWGEVYINEQRALNVTLTNAGSNALTVTDARLTAAVPAQLTGDLTVAEKTLGAGESVQVTLTFRPLAIPTDIAGALELVLGGGLPTVSVPLSGKAIHAQPRLCFKWDDLPTETCTDQVTTSLSLNAGSLCDRMLFPPDGGPSPCRGLDGGAVGYERTARLYYRNEGNTPVSYSVRYQSQAGFTCDGGSSIDFEFSNAPATADGGRQADWSEATVKLPALVTDPRPWETAPLTMAYRARSRCAADSADQARVLWTRQAEPPGTNRTPATLLVILDGKSLLPRGVPQDVTFQGTVPLESNFIGVGNAGDAPLRVTSVALWQAEYLALPDGGVGRGTVPFEQCIGGSTGDCATFAWAPGQDPNASLPTTLAGTSNPVSPTTRTLGRIVFGPADAGTQPLLNREYRVFAVITTDDPYNPQVVCSVRGTAR